MSNRLVHESSPYLRQHADNPVDWYPWGPEAFDKARREDKPIFLSIGYSTCHWCHVMAHESFEDDEVAKILNEDFVSIKVDREERPDIDQIYMAAVQAMTQRGGWPLSAWLTPDLKPFVGGTYFPNEHFKTLLGRISEAWKTHRQEIERNADTMAGQLQKLAEPDGSGELNLDAVLQEGFLLFERGYEPDYGGFAQAPKFPPSTTISFLLRYHRRTGSPGALEMAEKTLVEMARGGMYDQLGGGFHRYSTDAMWLVPHFEKMLYDNALLVTTYLEAYQLTKKDLYAGIVRETVEYILRDMTSTEGAFYSAEDADSEGVEGKLYVWNPNQVKEILGEKDGEIFCRAFGVVPEGNWEPFEESIPKGQSVLHFRFQPEQVAKLEKLPLEAVKRVIREGKQKLFDARSHRIRPHLDDKTLTSWNALMISAMAHAAQILEEPKYRKAAECAARFILSRHRKSDRLLRTSREGEAKLDAYLDDYAYLSAAMLDLYETTFDPAYFKEAQWAAAKAVELFWDETADGFFYTAKGHETLIARMREEHEGPIPTANAVLAMTLLRLHGFTGETSYRQRAEKTVQSLKASLERHPASYPYLLCVIDFIKGPSREIVIAGPDPEALLRVVRQAFVPNKVVALANSNLQLPILEGRSAIEGKAVAYVCENMSCQRPVTEPSELEAILKQ